MKFTQITDKLNYPAKYRGKLSTLHAGIITYVIENFQNKGSYRSQVIGLLNTISYYILEGDTLPSDWSITNPFENLDIVSQYVCEDRLNPDKLFIRTRDVEWDIEAKDHPTEAVEAYAEVKNTKNTKKSRKVTAESAPTPKEHLYIRPPTVPQFDTSKPWLKQSVNGIHYTIYTSLPEIPTQQCQISVTSDVSKMTTADCMKLYPNCHIRTRPAAMYVEHPGLTLDEDVGILIPIIGFSPSQIKDNIVRYPHWFKLTRVIDDNVVSFYLHIEIDGKLYDTLEVWNSIPESKQMPRNADFIKEYVVRRYLLERDLQGVKHNYPIFGTLDPFLTLFTTPDNYKDMGYPDAAEYARQCVVSRVNYKSSRNPIIRQVKYG